MLIGDDVRLLNLRDTFFGLPETLVASGPYKVRGSIISRYALIKRSGGHCSIRVTGCQWVEDVENLERVEHHDLPHPRQKVRAGFHIPVILCFPRLRL